MSEPTRPTVIPATRRIPPLSCGVQRDADELFIVHTGKDDPSWKAGGPLGPDLDTALAAWPHTVESLEGGLQSNLAGVLERLRIDVVVLGEQSLSAGDQRHITTLPASGWQRVLPAVMYDHASLLATMACGDAFFNSFPLSDYPSCVSASVAICLQARTQCLARWA